MKNPTLLANITVALLISLMSLGIQIILQTLFFTPAAVNITLALVALCYLGYLFNVSPARPGKVTLVLLSVLTTTTLLMLGTETNLLIGVLIGTLWLSRSLLFYHSVLASFADLALCLIGFTAAVGAFLLSASIAAGVWCFLLIQALFIFIPGRKSTPEKYDTDLTCDPFNKAYQSAESAIRDLANRS